MLESSTQQMHLRTKSLLSKPTRFVTILANHDRCLQLSRNQQRLIPKIPRQPTGIDQQHAPSPSPIPARKHIKVDSPRLQQLAQQNNKRRLSRSSSGNISHPDHQALNPPPTQNSVPREDIP